MHYSRGPIECNISSLENNPQIIIVSMSCEKIWSTLCKLNQMQKEMMIHIWAKALLQRIVSIMWYCNSRKKWQYLSKRQTTNNCVLIVGWYHQVSLKKKSNLLIRIIFHNLYACNVSICFETNNRRRKQILQLFARIDRFLVYFTIKTCTHKF